MFAVNLRPRSIIASPPGPVHDHLGQRHRLELRCCRGVLLVCGIVVRMRTSRRSVVSHHGFAAIPDPGRRRRDPHRLSRRARGHLGVHSTGCFSMWLLPRRPSGAVVLCVSCLRLSACAHVARVLWECAVACRRREVKSTTAAPAREDNNTESPRRRRSSRDARAMCGQGDLAFIPDQVRDRDCGTARSKKGARYRTGNYKHETAWWANRDTRVWPPLEISNKSRFRAVKNMPASLVHTETKVNNATEGQPLSVCISGTHHCLVPEASGGPNPS